MHATKKCCNRVFRIAETTWRCKHLPVCPVSKSLELETKAQKKSTMALPRSMNITMNMTQNSMRWIWILPKIPWIFPKINFTQTRARSKNPTPPPFRAREKRVVTIGNIVTRHNSNIFIHYTYGRFLKGTRGPQNHRSYWLSKGHLHMYCCIGTPILRQHRQRRIILALVAS